MSKKGFVVLLSVCLLAGSVGLVFGDNQAPVDAKAKLEYQAFRRSDIERMASERTQKTVGQGVLNFMVLTEGLNVLAKQGWELVAIEPYWEQKIKEERGPVTYPHEPTYIFKRQK
jgi:hypothetical protein